MGNEEINNINIVSNNNATVPPEFIVFNIPTNTMNAPNENDILNAINSLINIINVPSVSTMPDDNMTDDNMTDDNIIHNNTNNILLLDNITVNEFSKSMHLKCRQKN